MRAMSLMYHDVSADGTESEAAQVEDWYTVGAKIFSDHLDAVGARLPPTLVTDRSSGDRVYITFDDGEESAASRSAPMLERRGWRGHFFVVSSLIDTDGYLTQDEVRALASSGHVIGSHSHTHPVMTKLGDSELKDEWKTSREILEEILDAPVVVASVPTGYYSDRIGRGAMEAGYRHLFTSEPWVKSRPLGQGTIYGRFIIRRATSAATVGALCAFSRSAVARQWLEWEARKALKLALGPVYEDVRRGIINRL